MYCRLASATVLYAASGGNFKVILTGGSEENLNLLALGKADFAIVQSDVLRRALRGHEPFPDPINNLLVVTPLYSEVVHVLVRSDLYISTTEELKGKRVSLGPVGSGTDTTARAILEASGVSLDEIKVSNLSLDSLSAAFRDETIDAAFVTSAIPAGVVNNAMKNEDARLLFLSPQVLDRLVRSGVYRESAIPRMTYPGQADTSESVGVQAVLVTREGVDNLAVEAIVSALRTHQNEIERAAGVKLDLIGTSLPFETHIHPSARVLQARGDQNLWLFAAPTMVLLALVSWLAVKKRQLIRHRLSALADLILGLAILVTTCFAGAFGLYHFEQHVNENFATVPKAIWSVLVYLSGGFQSRAPLTRAGEAVAVSIIVIGVGVFAWFIAHFASRLITSRLTAVIKDIFSGRHSVHSDMKDHIIIVNWDERVENMIRQIRNPDVLDKRAIVVICQKENCKFPDDPEFDQCYMVIGDARERQILKKACAMAAHSVTITSAWHGGSPSEHSPSLASDAADSKTILTIVALRGMAADLKDDPKATKLHITAEIVCGHNIGVANDAGRGGPTEIVCVESFGTHILTQCAVTPGLAALYEDLLTFGADTDEIYKIPVADQFLGETFAYVLRKISEAQDNSGISSDSAIPIGIYRDRTVLLNPGNEILCSGDQLFVICDTPQVFAKWCGNVLRA
jgi:TRAP transporter TAXI family solute receptor